jgi:hypothetical protein
MKTAFAVLAVLTVWACPGASAASLCNCCGDGTLSSCTTACATISPSPGQCVATIDPSGETNIGPDQNPLYDVSLRNTRLDPSARSSVEAFRHLLETARKGAERDRRSALRAIRTHKIDDGKAQSLASRYDDAMVNYYLGVQAYLLAVRKPNQGLPPSP